MPGALEALDAILQGVDGGTLTAPEAIEQLLAAQIQLRNNRRLQAAMRSSRLPVVKQLRDFDFTFQPSLRREQIESLHELGFVERRENVIFLGPPGVGKTHLAISLAIAAAQSGRRVYYGTLADLITSLEEAQAAGRLQARLKVLTHPALLVVDEIGYLPISRTGAMLFFQLMTRRYEHASTVLTSNKGFEEWGEIFGDDVMAAALIDRLVHHCHLVTIRGNSYRMRQHTELWQTLHAPQDPEPAAVAGGLVRRPRRTEARPLVDLSDFQSAELSDFGPALTAADVRIPEGIICRAPRGITRESEGGHQPPALSSYRLSIVTASFSSNHWSEESRQGHQGSATRACDIAVARHHSSAVGVGIRSELCLPQHLIKFSATTRRSSSHSNRHT